MDLVLSLFPGIGLLDRAFELEGFCVVRGPDLLWGGDVKLFHSPSGVFTGIIGGPPCQAHSTYAGINRAIGNRIAEDLVPEFVRVIVEARPHWFLMENVPKVPSIEIEGYSVHRQLFDNRWLGEEQSRKRAFQFGTLSGARLEIVDFALEHPCRETACMATEGASGRIKFRRGKSIYTPRRDFKRFCELQGLASDFLSDAPLTNEGKFRMVGNGVPLPLGRALARAVRNAMARKEEK